MSVVQTGDFSVKLRVHCQKARHGGPCLQSQLWGGGDRQIPGAGRTVSLDLGMSPRPMKDSNPNNTVQRQLSG